MSDLRPNESSSAPEQSSSPHDESTEYATLVARIADDFKGKNTVVLDMRSVTPIFDFFVITSANSSRQMRAMAEEVDRVMKSRGRRKLGTEGEDVNSLWLLHDFGDVVLHVFTPEGRALYDLEQLWADAPRVEWQAPGRDSGDGEDAPRDHADEG